MVSVRVGFIFVDDETQIVEFILPEEAAISIDSVYL